MKAYSQDLRKRVIAAREQGQSGASVARRYNLCVRTVERYWERYQQSGMIDAKRRGGYRRSRLEGHDGQLLRWLNQKNDLSLVELQNRCSKELQVTISIHALWHRLKRIGLSSKKNDARRRARSS